MDEGKVVKIGGGVLGTIENAKKNDPKTIDLIRRENLGARKSIYVLSAYKEETRKLAIKAQFDRGVEKYTPEYDKIVSQGEEDAVLAIYSLLSKMKEFEGRVGKILRHNVPIVTNSNHGNADIKKVDVEYLYSLLEIYDRLLAVGFVGLNDYLESTTLGNNGSDTSAIAIAAALRWMCILIKDTGAVFTADPKSVIDVIKLDNLNLSHANILAALGSNIIHSKGTTYAEMSGIDITIRAVDGSSETLISRNVEQAKFSGLAIKKALEGLRLSAVGREMKADEAYEVLRKLNIRAKKSETPYRNKVSSVILQETDPEIMKRAINVLHNHFAQIY